MDNTQQQNAGAPRYTSRAIIGDPQVPSIITFLVERGWIKNPRRAGIVLVGIIIFNFVSIITLFVLNILDIL